VGYVPIEAKEVQNLLKNFKEAIRNTENQTWELIGRQEVVGHKESLIFELVELQKISRLVGDKQFI
jgi:hypothetical protein